MRSRSETKTCKDCGAVGTFAWLSTASGHKLVDAALDEKGRVIRDAKMNPVPAVPTVLHACAEGTKTRETEAPTGALEAAILAVLRPYLKASLDESKVEAILDRMLDQREETGPRPIQIGEAPVLVMSETDHKHMNKLVYFANLAPSTRTWPFLYGPSGTGKSHAVIRYGQLMGRPLYMLTLGPATMKSDVFGFALPTGGVFRTQFREAWEHGGICLLDEFDQCNPETGVLLGGALANGHCAFPDGLLPRHKDCLIVATGNTPMRGGTKGHEGRRKLDVSTQDRFAFVPWPRDVKAERARIKPLMGDNTEPFMTWLDRLRAHIDIHRPEILSSQRGSVGIAIALATRAEGIMAEDILEAFLFRGIEEGVRKAVLAAAPVPEFLR